MSSTPVNIKLEYDSKDTKKDYLRSKLSERATVFLENNFIIFFCYN
jgi:hypothetical protein